MPIYEYACGKCDHEFEVEQRITDDPVKTCPNCRSRKVKRLISRTSFSLKGGGWYSDLYSSAKGAAKSDDKPDGSGGGAKDGGKGSDKESKKDSKDATKSSGDSKTTSSSSKSPKAAA